MELWDLYDRERRPLGITHERGKPIPEGAYHLTVHIAIITPDGRMLVQRRSPRKKHWGGLWDMSAAGSVTVGEDSATGASRELYEELGLSYDFSAMRPQFTINYRVGFGDVYVIEMDITEADIHFDGVEVVEVGFMSREEILASIREGEFIPYYESFISFLFDRLKTAETMRSGFTGDTSDPHGLK